MGQVVPVQQRRTRRVVACLLVALVALPVAAAQSAVPVSRCSRECDPLEANGGKVREGDEPVKLILYGHFEDLLDRAPLNTQRPDQEGDLAGSFLMPILYTWGLQAGSVNGNFKFQHNRFEMFSSPGLVQYTKDGWRTHQDQGMGFDLPLLGTHANLYWYMSANATAGSNRPAPAGAMPQVGVYARMETGRSAFRGQLLAEGGHPDSTSYASAGRTNMLSIPGQPAVYEFKVPMKILLPAFPSSHNKGFNVYVSPYQFATDSSPPVGADVGQPNWRIHTGRTFAPRVVFETREPIRAERLAVEVSKDQLYARWSVSGALGQYDFADQTVNLSVMTPDGPLAPKLVIVKRPYLHHGFNSVVNITWALGNASAVWPDGTYRVNASIENYQRNYRLSQEKSFEFVGGVPQVAGSAAWQKGEAPAPAFALILLVLLLGALLSLSRRRP